MTDWKQAASMPHTAIAAALGLLERIALAFEEIAWPEITTGRDEPVPMHDPDEEMVWHDIAADAEADAARERLQEHNL